MSRCRFLGNPDRGQDSQQTIESIDVRAASFCEVIGAMDFISKRVGNTETRRCAKNAAAGNTPLPISATSPVFAVTLPIPHRCRLSHWIPPTSIITFQVKPRNRLVFKKRISHGGWRGNPGRLFYSVGLLIDAVNKNVVAGNLLFPNDSTGFNRLPSAWNASS